MCQEVILGLLAPPSLSGWHAGAVLVEALALYVLAQQLSSADLILPSVPRA